MHLTPEDIRSLLGHLALAGDLVVFDHEGGRCWSGEDIGICVDGNAIQIVVAESHILQTQNQIPQTECQTQHTAPQGDPAVETEEERMRTGILSVLERKQGTREYFRRWLNASTKTQRAILGKVLNDLRAEGVVEASHGRYWLGTTPGADNSKSSHSAGCDGDEGFLAEMVTMT